MAREVVERISDLNKVDELTENKILFQDDKENVFLKNSEIIFKGKNNIVFLENDVTLRDSTMIFEGNNNVVYLSSTTKLYLLKVTTFNNSVFYMGENNYLSGTLYATISERKHLLIGDEGVFSFGLFIRLADGHMIYDVNTHERINPSKSVFIGDRVWLGQDSIILKGTKIGSGSIVGAKSVVSGKTIPSNTVWGGNPAKQIKKDVFFTKTSVNGFKAKKTKKTMVNEDDLFIYEKEEGITKSFGKIEKDFNKIKDPEEKLQYIIENIRNCKEKNRFFVGEAKKPSLKSRIASKFKK